MNNKLKSHSTYTDEDVLRWVESRTDATRASGARLPEWMIGGFEEAMMLRTESEATGATAQGGSSEDHGYSQDDVFNFELVYFKVERTMFTVIKDWLMVEGSPLRDMFSLPNGDGTLAPSEGTSITDPIILEQTSAASFKAFLRLLYGPRGKPLETYNEWVGALELAIRWNFVEVRKQAVAGLQSLVESLGPAARITLARRFSVGPWLRLGLIELVTEVHDKRLTRNDLVDRREFALDMSTIADVFYACFEVERLNTGPISLQATNVFCQHCITNRNRRGFDCGSCKILRQGANTRHVVDGIFGVEIEGCLYAEEL